MKALIVSNRWFFIPFFFLFAIGLSIEFINGSVAFTFWLNEQHTPYLDSFFRMATWLGEGLVIGLFILLLLFIRFSWALFLFVAIIINTAITQWLKHFFNHDRPSLALEGENLPFVDGVELYQHFSFPSGHTSAAFCLYLMLAMMSGYKRSGVLFLFTAFLVGFSRIYILQHFLRDVLFGATIGVVVALIVYLILGNWKVFERRVWKSSLRTVFKKK